MAGRRGHAVVIGGSLAGLAAAGALVRHVERVTLIERDRFPQRLEFRKGVPQARHLHMLLPSGQRALEGLFPGFNDDLLAAGAVPVCIPRDWLWLTPAGWSSRFHGTHRFLSASRPLIDWTLRRHVEAAEGVVIRGGSEVTGLLGDGGRVGGVRVRERDGGQAAEIAADLVVEASGRRSRMPDWLEALGCGRPAQTRIDAGLAYASRRYAIPPGFAADWKAIVLLPKPPELTRLGLVAPLEGGRWIVTLGGAGGDHPPTDEAGFLAFARSLRHPLLYEAILGAEPLTPIHGYRQTANERRHYEAMARWPERLMVVGDAACAFNPIYGQGMSVAAMTAAALDRWLGECGGDLNGCAGFREQVAACNADAWMLSSSEDLRYRTTVGARADGQTTFLHRYMDRALSVAVTDEVLLTAMADVLTLLAPAASMFSHAITERIARGPLAPPPSEPPPLRAPLPAAA